MTDRVYYRPLHRQISARMAGILMAITLSASAWLTPAMAQDHPAPGQSTQATEDVRFVFMPDFHLRRDLNSPKGMAKALQAVESIKPKPQFIVTGGDLIHDMRSMDLKEANEMAALFQKIWKENITLPAYQVLGNHDVAGLNNEDFPRDHPLYGSNFLKEKLDMPGLYYSFDHGGWHFVVLHNFTVTADGSFVSEYDDEQLAFLRKDLKQAGDKPTVIFSHYPAVTAIEFFDGEAEQGEQAWKLGYGRASRNPMAVVEAIDETGADVKALLGGHIHRLDHVQVKDLQFIGSGSVSGDQWKGPDVGYR